MNVEDWQSLRSEQMASFMQMYETGQWQDPSMFIAGQWQSPTDFTGDISTGDWDVQFSQFLVLWTD